MIFANEYGFLPENDGLTNAQAFQKAVDEGGNIFVEKPGVYELADTIKIGDDTVLCFGSGVYIKRIRNTDETGNAFINKGAYTHSYNNNIKLIGLRLICNNVVCEYKGKGKTIVGLKGHISFHYVKNVLISDFECIDLPAQDFAIQVCTFEDLIVENVHIEGLKDGVHLGRGRNFIIRNGIFKTYDDPIALNAHDYSTSNPQLGWIENGFIENCVDMDDNSTTGFFCRILAGSWTKWAENMKIQKSDSVVSNGAVYRCVNEPDGIERVSKFRPTHTEGIKNYGDGILWVMVQDDEEYNCGCRNIVFSNIRIEKKRPIAFSVHFDKDNFSRSYYPGSEAPIQSNIIMNNVTVKNDVPVFLCTLSSLDRIELNNCDIGGGDIVFKNINTDGIEYIPTEIIMNDTINLGKIQCDNGRSCKELKE